MKKLPNVALVVLASSVFLSCVHEKEESNKKETPISVRVTTPLQVSGERISVSGQIESRGTAIISTRMMGFISSISVKPGDRVQKGQLLAAISNDDVKAKRAQAEAMVLEAEAALKDAEKDFNRFEKLYKQESASEKEFENALLRFNSIKAKGEAAHQMKNEANAMLEYTNLVAPFAGVITQKHINAGSMANPGMPILTMDEPGGFQIRAFVSESEVGKLKNGMDADVTIKSTERKFKARISEISPSSQFTGGQFQIKLTVPAIENAGLFSGVYVNVSFDVKGDVKLQRMFVPASAIVHRDQLTGLYTVDDNQTAQLRWLKVGKIQGKDAEILSGLNPGEEFIVESDSRLYSGAPVSITGNDLTLAQ